MRKNILLAFLIIVVQCGMGRADAVSSSASEWALTEHGRVRLIAAVDAVGEDASVPIALQFRMNPGWHIYWRSPGDAGYPPRVDWSRSYNLASAEISWPAPRRFSVLDIQTIGYEAGVTLPIEARPERAGQPLSLRAHVDYLTCADICVPYTAELSLDLPAGAARASQLAHDIARARAAVPRRDAAHGLGVEGVAWAEDAEPQLLVRLRSTEPLRSPDVFVETEAPLAFGAAQARVTEEGREAEVIVPVFNADQSHRNGEALPVTLTIVDGDRALEHAAEVSRSATGNARSTMAGDNTRPVSWPMMLAIAFLGGLILNLMPCVLPVLSVKLLGVVSQGGGARRTVRAGFLAAAAGILFSFMVMAGALVVLKATGGVIGWGMQFQQPWFLTAMILVITLFACNLWGLFDVPLPRAFGLADERAGRVRGLAAHFLTGALATLLATPCSAPFLGTAISFALAGSATEIFAIFVAIATGLALPYLAVAAVPALATRLPRPGRWMIVLRRVLGVALAATAGWLASVLVAAIGWQGALAIGAIAAALPLLLALRRWLPRRMRAAAMTGVAALAVSAFLVPTDKPNGAPELDASAWRPLEPQRIATLVAEGRTVFVNVTADWCLTCKVNERLVLSRDPVRSLLAGEEIVAMQGDWTVPDDHIARYLASFGRYGIPFDAVYGPALPRGEALPELLSSKIVVDALARAEGEAKGGH